MSSWLIARSSNYSVRNDFTGFASAAFIAWKLTVANAIIIAINPAIANNHQLILMRYAKPCNHLFIVHHATGKAIMNDATTNWIKSFESNATIRASLAPNTFLTPISFMRCRAENAARPNRPRQEIIIDKMEKTLKSFSILCSVTYNLDRSSFTNPYEKR